MGAYNRHRPTFGVKVDGVSVFEYRFSSPTGSRVASSLRFEELNARVAAGMTQAEYDALPGSPRWAAGGMSKADVLIWHRANEYLKAVADDKAARKAKHK